MTIDVFDTLPNKRHVSNIWTSRHGNDSHAMLSSGLPRDREKATCDFPV